MSLSIDMVNTRDLPLTHDILQRVLPTILRSQCFNDGDVPFFQEVKHTEIGHLFEHILLEYLCIHKLALGYQRASYTGLTSWNWKRDKRGTFHIKINAGEKDGVIFSSALKNSVDLLTFLLNQHLTQPIQLHTPLAYSG